MFVRKLVGQLTDTHSGITKKDVDQLEATARKAAESLSGVAPRAAAPRAVAKASSASAAESSASVGSRRESESDAKPSAVSFSSSTVGGMRASGLLGASGSASLGASGGAAGGAGAAPSAADLAEAARRALEATSKIVCTPLDALPEPRIFAARRKKEELRRGFAHQVAEHEVERMRRAEVERAFAGAGSEIASRAKTVEERQAAMSKQKALENSLAVRSYLAEQRALAAKLKAEKLAEEERFLAAMKAELEAEERHAAELKEKERESIAESIAENNRLRALREEMARKAVEEEMRLQKESAQRLAAAEEAHKDKYRHIAEKQAKLVEALVAATEADRAKQAAFDEATRRRAEERDAALAEGDRRRAEDRKRRLAEQTVVLHQMVRHSHLLLCLRVVPALHIHRCIISHLCLALPCLVLPCLALQMADRQAEVLKRREEDVVLAASATEMARTVMSEKAATLASKRSAAKVYGEELRGIMRERELSRSPTRRHSKDDAPGFLLKTESTDMDLEATFKREMVRQLGLENKRANNSEAVAPLLGFAAAFPAALEAAGSAAAESKAAEVMATVEANPLSAIKPSRIEPRATVRGIAIGKKKL